MTRDEAIAAAMAVYWDCEHESEPEARVAFLASLAASGFAVVPVEVTPTMLARGWSVLEGGRTSRPMLGPGAGLKEVWSAMLAAAQEDGE